MTAPELVPGDRVTFPVTVSGTVLPSDVWSYAAGYAAGATVHT